MIIGEFLCPNCGLQHIKDATTMQVFYPKGTEKPQAQIICEHCDFKLKSKVEWVDAYTFDTFGADAYPFSFARGALVDESEIDSFIDNFDSEMEDFLDACVEQN